MAPAEPPKQMSRTSFSESNPVSSGQNNRADETTPDDHGTKSWYMRSWPRRPKAPAITELARESISAAGTKASEHLPSTTSLPNPPRSIRSPTIGLTKKGGDSTRSLPADATTTRINIASTRSSSVPKMSDSLNSGKETHDKGSDKAGGSPEKPDDSSSEVKNKEDEIDKERNQDNKEGNQESTDKASTETTQETVSGLDQQPSGWFGWLSRTKNGPNESAKQDDKATDEMLETTEAEQSENRSKPESEQGASNKPPVEATQSTGDVTATSTSQRRSWLQMLTASGTTSHGNETSEPISSKEANQQVDSASEPPRAENAAETPQNENADVAAQSRHSAKPSSGWIFWSRDQQQVENVKTENDQKSDESSFLDPTKQQESTQSMEGAEPPKAAGTVKKQTKKAVAEGSPAAPTQVDTSQQDGPNEAPTPVAKPPPTPSTRKTQLLPNQLLPSVKSTFHPQGSPGIIQKFNRWLHSDNHSQPGHVSLVREPPRLKKALAIGIHGYFPAPLIRTVLGQPTGTSVKFATQAANAILEWADSHHNPCEVEKIALEGEGRIEERLEVLWKLLLNWIEHIRSADFILIACHSQGVPVATMLVAKLISFGCVNSARIGICAMAGVSLGPFPDYRSRWISGSAAELFDFANPTSNVSGEYIAALRTTLDFGVRITYVGSIDDQLVSLESATFASVSHPHIYRAVFVDGRVHAPSFLSHLVGFAMKLRNLGISDHGLIRELSVPLAGSLYSGEGHSRLYDDDGVYRLAVEYALETTSVPHAIFESHKRNTSHAPNPFILPFAMRGVLEEEYVRRELAEETTALLRQFEEWKPTSKVLKDVKFRLEGIRSKL